MAAFAAHPQRFKALVPEPPEVPTAVWINPPIKEIIIPVIIVPTLLNSSPFVSQSR
jgi:putative transposase